MKKLKLSGNKVLLGVAAGFAEYFDIDPTIARIAWVVISLAGGAGLIVYLICYLIMKNA